MLANGCFAQRRQLRADGVRERPEHVGVEG